MKQMGNVPTVSIDYMLMAEDCRMDEDDQEGTDTHAGVSILVMVDHPTDMVFSSVVPKEGVNPYAVLRVSNGIALLGHGKLILKGDNIPLSIGACGQVRTQSTS